MAQTFSLAGIPLFAAPDYTGSTGSGGFEVPADLELGLSTWGSTHRIPTTGVSAPKIITQTFGVFPKPIKWEASWIGPQADARSRQIAGIHQQQKVVSFVAGTRAYDVVIWDYVEKLHAPFEIAYAIELNPIADRSGRVAYGPSPTSAPVALTANYLALQDLQDDVPDDSRADDTSDALATALTDILAAQPEPSAPTSQLLALALTCQTALSFAEALQLLLENSSAPADTPTYIWAGNVAGTLQAYLGTLGEYTAANQSTTIVVGSGTDLMTVAATQLGDWTRFTDLMAINGLTDPFITAPTTIALPAS